MKKRIQTLLAALLITMVAVPAYAALYDASGRWLIETLPDQTISIAGLNIEIPDAWLWATIDQSEDTFTMVTDEIEELGNITYSGAGTIEVSLYTFDPVLEETVDLGDIPGFEDYAGFSFTVSLYGFELISENALVGEFKIGSSQTPPTIAFTGAKEVVPLPAAVWFMGTGVIGLIGLRRRYRA